MLGLPQGIFYSMMVLLLSLKIPCRYHHSLSWVYSEYQPHGSRQLPSALRIWSILGNSLRSIQIANPLAFCCKTIAEWVSSHYFWLVAYHDISLLTFMIEAAVCDYKILLGLLTMQEETNPLWFNNFLHFGTTANMCIEVPHDHQVVRW